jgi:uncharacterized protein YggU (UPF0235/DUF167 family)
VNIPVKVIAGAKRRELRLDGAGLKAKLLAKPIQGRANEELIELIADAFGLKRREVEIVAGERDTRKIVSVPIDEDRLRGIMKKREGTD